MNAKLLSDMIGKRPFRAFTIRMANGARIRITNPDYVAVHPKGGLFLFESDGGFRILDILLIAELQQKQAGHCG
jgi:hypothetical protein